MKNIAIFASGSGTNAQRIIEYFENKEIACIKIVFSNKKDAFVLERAKKLGVKTVIFSREEFYNTNNIVEILRSNEIDLVVLAGFLWLVPQNLIRAFPQRIINIHPALLPKYGGKGMYGHFVHEAVIANKDKESGITIHYVNEQYDEGNTIAQFTCTIAPTDTPETLAEKIHLLEYENFPVVIERLIKADNLK